MSYEVNALGLRVRKVATATGTDILYFYDSQGQLIGEAGTGNGSFSKEYVYLGNMPVAVLAGTSVNYIHADHLNTPRLITSTTGAVVWTWENLDPFGNSAANENPNGLGRFEFNLRFAGQYFDKETGTHYNVNRDYDPSKGRYIQSDPIGLDGGINTYSYSYENPLSYTDPTGLAVVVIIETGQTGQQGKNDALVYVLGGKNGLISPAYNGSSLPGDPNKCATVQSGIYDYKAQFHKKYNKTVLRILGDVPVIGGLNPNPNSDSAQGKSPVGTANGVLNHPSYNNPNGLCGCTGVKKNQYDEYISNFKKDDTGSIIVIRLEDLIPIFMF